MVPPISLLNKPPYLSDLTPEIDSDLALVRMTPEFSYLSLTQTLVCTIMAQAHQ